MSRCHPNLTFFFPIYAVCSTVLFKHSPSLPPPFTCNVHQVRIAIWVSIMGYTRYKITVGGVEKKYYGSMKSAFWFTANGLEQRALHRWVLADVRLLGVQSTRALTCPWTGWIGVSHSRNRPSTRSAPVTVPKNWAKPTRRIDSTLLVAMIWNGERCKTYVRAVAGAGWCLRLGQLQVEQVTEVMMVHNLAWF